MADEAKTFMIENAQLIFKNFSGRESQYNREGDKNFAVIIPDEAMAQQMLKDGWSIKYLNPREEGDEPTPYIAVNVSYKGRPPRIVLLTETARTNVDEHMVETLDWVNIKTADLIARAYNWTVGDKSGVKAYLQSLFITVDEDFLEQKYAANDFGGE